MEKSQIFLAGTTKQQNVPVGLRGISFMAKTAIAVLSIKGSHENVVGEFKKIFVVSACRADEAIGYSCGVSVNHLRVV